MGFVSSMTSPCPSCGYDGGKWGHQKQINPDNPFKWICGSCSQVFGK